MIVLALDSSSKVSSVAVMNHKRLICEKILNHKKTHSEELMPMVADIIKSAGMKPMDVDVFAAAQGPGSFTGLRIGIASIKGMAHALDKPVVGISSLDGLAFNVPFFDGIICPIMDARSNQTFTALYYWNNNTINRISDYMAISIEELLKILKKKKERVVFVGEGIEVFRDILSEGMGEYGEFAPITCSIHRASSIACLALEKILSGSLQSYMDFRPFYLRQSQAERVYNQKNNIRIEESNG